MIKENEMANYKSKYTGKQIDEAVGKPLKGGGGTASAWHTFTIIGDL